MRFAYLLLGYNFKNGWSLAPLIKNGRKKKGDASSNISSSFYIPFNKIFYTNHKKALKEEITVKEALKAIEAEGQMLLERLKEEMSSGNPADIEQPYK